MGGPPHFWQVGCYVIVATMWGLKAAKENALQPSVHDLRAVKLRFIVIRNEGSRGSFPHTKAGENARSSLPFRNATHILRSGLLEYSAHFCVCVVFIAEISMSHLFVRERRKRTTGNVVQQRFKGLSACASHVFPYLVRFLRFMNLCSTDTN